jgi:hypothetical protein
MQWMVHLACPIIPLKTFTSFKMAKRFLDARFRTFGPLEYQLSRFHYAQHKWIVFYVKSSRYGMPCGSVHCLNQIHLPKRVLRRYRGGRRSAL